MAKSKKSKRKAVAAERHDGYRYNGETGPLTRAAPTVSVRPSALAGRATVDSVQDVFSSSLRILAPLSSDDFWHGYGLDQRTLERVPMWKLVELLIDLSPDVSKGIWDWQRLFNPGYEVKALKLGTAEETVDERAQAALDAFLGQLHGPYSETNQVPANIIINTVSMQAFLRGGMFAELVLDRTGKMPLEIATPDPQTIRFKRITDEQRGRVWQLGQYQGIIGTSIGVTSIGGYGITPLDRPTVVYLPVDPLPGSPFGRPLIQPAVFATLFLIGLLHDLRRVVAQQGYPRLDLVIDMEKLAALMPNDLQGDTKAMQEWVAATVAEIESAYRKLQPDDAYVHADVVTVNSPGGAASGTNLTGLTGMDGVIKSLESMLSRALKTMPLLMGASMSETNGNRQWEVQSAGIKAIQHLAENLFERLLTLALQVQGIAARVVVRFSELRAAEMLRDSQTAFMLTKVARMQYDNGSISADQMAFQSTQGKKTKADVPEPRAAAMVTGGQIGSINADPGSQRFSIKPLGSTVRIDTKDRNAVAAALLLMSNQHPTETEVDDAIRFWNETISEADGILEPESVQ